MKTYEKVTETAKRIRKKLKEKFPQTKFSVKSSSYSMGSSINISWDDGYTKKEVENLVNQFQDISYDDYSGEILSGGNRFIFCNRTITDDFGNLIIEGLKEKFHRLNGFTYNDYKKGLLIDHPCINLIRDGFNYTRYFGGK